MTDTVSRAAEFERREREEANAGNSATALAYRYFAETYRMRAAKEARERYAERWRKEHRDGPTPSPGGTTAGDDRLSQSSMLGAFDGGE